LGIFQFDQAEIRNGERSAATVGSCGRFGNRDDGGYVSKDVEFVPAKVHSVQLSRRRVDKRRIGVPGSMRSQVLGRSREIRQEIDSSFDAGRTDHAQDATATRR